MSNYQVKNSCDKAIKFVLIRKIKDDKHVESEVKEDVVLYPHTIRQIPKLAGAKIEFPYPVDLTFRQKKALIDKLSLITKTVKESSNKVTSADLPALFTILKIKKIHM